MDPGAQPCTAPVRTDAHAVRWRRELASSGHRPSARSAASMSSAAVDAGPKSVAQTMRPNGEDYHCAGVGVQSAGTIKTGLATRWMTPFGKNDPAFQPAHTNSLMGTDDDKVKRSGV